MKEQLELFPLPPQERHKVHKVKLNSLGFDKTYNMDYGDMHDKYYVFKTGGYNRYLKDWGPIFPYVQNIETGTVLGCGSTASDHYVKFSCKYKDGYKGNNKGATRVFRIHRVAAFAFIKNPDPEKLTMVNHIDGNVLNYSLANLEWISPSNNVKGIQHFADKYSNRQKLLEEKGHSFDFKLE